MNNEMIKYEMINNTDGSGLNDLDGTFDDIGQLIIYLRDLSRQLVPLVDSLVPLSENLNDLIENLPNKLERFFLDNPFFAIGGVLGISMLGGYLGTGIIRNILEINKVIK
jgi:hypothetical protein